MTIPFGRSTVLNTFPAGSSKSISSLIPFAIPSIRPASNIKRSIMTSEIFPLAASTSCLFASKIASVCAKRASAILASALFLVSVSAELIAFFAVTACVSISFVVMLFSSR